MLSHLLVAITLACFLVERSGAFRRMMPSTVPALHRFSKNQLTLHSTPTSDAMTEWLDDMIYSGDIDGYIRRRSKDVVNDDFLDFVEDKLDACDDEDEKAVLDSISETIANRLDLNDGHQNAGEVFERRLDKILFTPPNQRRNFISENIEDMSLGFIEYVQSEMQESDDADSKVVMASILQIIGQEKQTDLLGKNVGILAGADKSLGDEYDTTIKSELLQDGSTFDSSERIGAGNSVAVGDRNEVILAGLMYSQNDILEDVLNNLHEINEEFITFLETKVEASRDMDERVGLTSLKDTIQSVLDRVKEAEGEGLDDVQDVELTVEQVKARMKEVQMGKEVEEEEKTGKRKFEEYQVQTDKKETFNTILRRFQGLPEQMSLKDAVKANYALCDYDFMQMLEAEIKDCQEYGADVEAQQYVDLQSTIQEVMAESIGSAQERLDQILKKGNPNLMQAEIGMMTRRGEVDEALILLIEANIQQATAAGAIPAAEVLRKLIERVDLERDRLQPDEQRLLRALLKLEDPEERKGLLYEFFRPQQVQDEVSGEWVDGTPVITPPAFINLVQGLIENFGNVDSFDIMGKAKCIIDEAQAVATELYGEGMTPQQQQRYMFEKKTLSVWDLANFEEQAMMSGEEVPWANDKYDNMNPEDVLGERVKKIGGMDDD